MTTETPTSHDVHHLERRWTWPELAQLALHLVIVWQLINSVYLLGGSVTRPILPILDNAQQAVPWHLQGILWVVSGMQLFGAILLLTALLALIWFFIRRGHPEKLLRFTYFLNVILLGVFLWLAWSSLNVMQALYAPTGIP